MRFRYKATPTAAAAAATAAALAVMAALQDAVFEAPRSLETWRVEWPGSLWLLAKTWSGWLCLWAMRGFSSRRMKRGTC